MRQYEPLLRSETTLALPPVRVVFSSISGSRNSCLAFSEVSQSWTRPHTVSAWPSVGANTPTQNPSLNFVSRSGYALASRGSSTIRPAMTIDRVSDLPDWRAWTSVISSESPMMTDSMIR